MHFWIDKRSQACGYNGRARVAASLSSGSSFGFSQPRRFRGKSMVTPIHRYPTVECTRPHLYRNPTPAAQQQTSPASTAHNSSTPSYHQHQQNNNSNQNQHQQQQTQVSQQQQANSNNYNIHRIYKYVLPKLALAITHHTSSIFLIIHKITLFTFLFACHAFQLLHHHHHLVLLHIIMTLIFAALNQVVIINKTTKRQWLAQLPQDHKLQWLVMVVMIHNCCRVIWNLAFGHHWHWLPFLWRVPNFILIIQ